MRYTYFECWTKTYDCQIKLNHDEKYHRFFSMPNKRNGLAIIPNGKLYFFLNLRIPFLCELVFSELQMKYMKSLWFCNWKILGSNIFPGHFFHHRDNVCKCVLNDILIKPSQGFVYRWLLSSSHIWHWPKGFSYL